MHNLATPQVLHVKNEQGIVSARQVARQYAVQLGFGAIDQSRIATAVSELTRNVVRYATDSSGTVTIGEISDGSRTGIEIVVADEGPGISDLESAMEVGYSSGKGMGLGLSGTKRLMDEMTMQSTPGRGTIVTIRKWRR
jgi:serine/threonine-protein kinase RsbT